MADEITSEQQEASEQSQEQEVSPQPSEESTNAVDGTQIPTKFVGKSFDEVLGAYKEVESYAGKMASEKAQAESAREALEQRIQELESQQRQSQYSQPEAQVEPEVDPFDEFDSKFDDDPKQAIRELAKQNRASYKAETAKQQSARNKAEAQEYYNAQTKENPDYKRREQTMLDIAKEYGDIFGKDMLNSAKGLKFLDMASKGRDVSYYESQAIERSKKDGLSTRDEKRAAQSDSSSSEGEDTTTSFGDLSLEEMRKILGRAD